ncbi:exonuclease I, putative [Plasmodium knowlesi strain H]|uniref:Exonuclease 1 n=3 Tax=Plasmodium knowlesi TaxID=5850 RepID=A0A5K1VP14_PLAKH|nr:exonuclease I, putative [Plasmodium knowlesi strain H]OTN68473.1 putative Exonuclease I [Plasmodium knowlesi]CAA9986629.1 exonuclease I, putative [Plasmodium knowlesi strain H]SBO24091.1 exonuclease I, putative [Plasmodium knowlesi strain H]SBO29339.1 exonuclease I, putative [Plasmodium knowlesi strain H]VVS76103.1 exonuclease I, putative [Plasmodium knowlesi strain H]|eukprot:XP_002261169.1 exonuclease I, putative [Plasmodium knowlesi strain H]
MGINNLLPFLKPIARSTHISKYKNEVVGVDIMCWIHRGLVSCAYDVIMDNYNDSYLSFIEKMLECIYEHNIKVIFVFDGEELPEKRAENVIRNERREKAKKEAQEIIKSVKDPRSDVTVRRKCTQALSVSKEIIRTVMNFCKTKNIDYIISPFEADAQLSYLCRMGYISCVISEDSDLLVYGCPRVLYKLKNTGECDEICLMPIDDLIDINLINKIRNPLSNSFNEFYITPMKEDREDAEQGDPSLEENNVPHCSECPPSAANQNPEKKEKSYDKMMKKYLDQFHWPKELDELKHFSIDMFLAMCILSGCDYTSDFHITGMGIKTAFSLTSKYKTIEQIFSFLISHQKWKRKIPPTLNTLEKMLNKYEEIKNAFFHHQVYDFILCEKISINQSFNSALEKNENKLLINKIREFSLIYDNNKRKGNCLNVYLEQLSDCVGAESSSLLPDGSGTLEGCTERSIGGEEKVDTAKEHHLEVMLKGNASTETPIERSPIPPKETEIKEQPDLDKQNNFENIFKNLTSECLEYLEISPDVFSNCDEGKNQPEERMEKPSLVSDYVGKYEEGSHVSNGWTNGWTNGWQNDNKNFVACHSGEKNPPNQTIKQEPPEGDTETLSPLYQRGTTQRANLWPPMECTKLSLFCDSPRSNGCTYGREYTNDDEEAEMVRDPNNSIDTIEPNEPLSCTPRNNLPGGKEKTKLDKRKGNHIDSLNLKKMKRCADAPAQPDGKTCRNLLDEKESDCSKEPGQNHHGDVLENVRLTSQSGDNSQGATLLKGAIAHGIDISIQKDETEWEPQKRENEEVEKEEGKEEAAKEGEVTNPTGGKNRKKSAKVMYQNMKRNFLLFRAFGEDTGKQMGIPSTELKSNSTQEKMECAHMKEIQGMCKTEAADEERGRFVEREIWDPKDKMASVAHGKLFSKPTAEENNRVKDEINETNFKSERTEYPSDVSFTIRSKHSDVNENNKNQLRITNFFKKSEREIPNMDGNKGGNNNAFPLRPSTNNSLTLNGKCSLSMNNSEPANKEQWQMKSPNELGIYERRLDGKITQYNNRSPLRSNIEKEDLPLSYVEQEIHDQDTHDEYVFLKNLYNRGLIKDSNRKESQMWTVEGGHTWDDRFSKGDTADRDKVFHSNHRNDHHSDRHDWPPLGDAPHTERPAEKKQKQKEINLEYILQNLNYNYHPRSHKINTFDYFKEKENVPPPNPYVDNNL